MLRRIRTRLPAYLLAGLAILILCHPARADLQVTLQGITPAAAASPTAITSGNGSIAFSLTSGIFSAGGTGYGSSFLGGPNMDLQSLAVSSSGAGTVQLIFSMSGLTTPVGAGTITETISGHVVTGSSPGSVSVAYQTFGSQANTLYTTKPVSNPPTVAGTNVANFSTTTGTTQTATGSFTSVNPYSLTEVLTITFSASGSIQLSSDSSAGFAVPEPSPIALALAGMPVLGLYWNRRRHRA